MRRSFLPAERRWKQAYRRAGGQATAKHASKKPNAQSRGKAGAAEASNAALVRANACKRRPVQHVRIASHRPFLGAFARFCPRGRGRGSPRRRRQELGLPLHFLALPGAFCFFSFFCPVVVTPARLSCSSFPWTLEITHPTTHKQSPLCLSPSTCLTRVPVRAHNW